MRRRRGIAGQIEQPTQCPRLPGKGGTAVRRHRDMGPRPPILEGLVDNDVARLLQHSQMLSEIAFGDIQAAAQRGEIGPITTDQGGQNSQPHPLVHHIIKVMNGMVHDVRRVPLCVSLNCVSLNCVSLNVTVAP